MTRRKLNEKRKKGKRKRRKEKEREEKRRGQKETSGLNPKMGGTPRNGVLKVLKS